MEDLLASDHGVPAVSACNYAGASAPCRAIVSLLKHPSEENVSPTIRSPVFPGVYLIGT